MTSLRLAAVALAITAAAACSSKETEHPPVSTEGTNGNSSGGGNGTPVDAGFDSATEEDAGTDAGEGGVCQKGVCTGCCDNLTNVCRPGNDLANCGVNGNLCQSCAQTGFTTYSAACQCL